MIPQGEITVTHGATNYILDVLSWEVILRENAIRSLQMTVDDKDNAICFDRCDVGDNVKLEFRYADETSTYTQLFGGWIEDLVPSINTSEGNLLNITALGYDVALKNMLVRQQYGSQSENPTLYILDDILKNVDKGIISRYVNKVMDTETSSGYSIGTTKVGDINTEFRYLYFPGKPANKCLEDIIDLACAANPAAGVHWFVHIDGTSAYLCVATVANHENPPADVWPTWWNTDRTGSTFEVGKDAIVTTEFRKLRSEGNYVLMAANFRRPPSGDKWTENSASEWDCDTNGVLANDSTAKVWGSYSVSFTKSTSDGKCWYPKTGTLNFDITKIGTKKIIPELLFYVRKQSLGAEPNLMVHMKNDATNYFSRSITSLVNEDDKWFSINLPIGPYYQTKQTDNKEWLKNTGNEVWTDIDYIGFCIVGGESAKIWVDGLHIDGMIQRVAYDSSKFSGQKCRMLFVRDDVPKDDSLVASDDSGEVAQFAKAELYRAVTTPTVGEIQITLNPAIKPGQFCHIHAKPKLDGSFAVDKDMRIMQVRHAEAMRGALTYLSLTDDYKNSIPRNPTERYNILMKAVAPMFQDRLRSSLTTGDIDVTQPILAKEYST